ncbi:Trafficking protein particle complex subunit 23 [Spathaspora sp. JA1]|nr:Trafficking protein particle complex subunit 23 [Spathaspora sp. JA1]
MLYSILILNKAGGLIYQNEVNPGLNKLSTNDYLVLAGSLHGIHAIGAQLTPAIGDKTAATTVEEFNRNQNNSIMSRFKALSPNTNRSGLQNIETSLFNLYIFQTVTGLKFMLITAPNGVADATKAELNKQYDMAHELFRQLYMLYSDYVMKDPFYSLDMPIKNPLFDTKVKELVT